MTVVYATAKILINDMKAKIDALLSTYRSIDTKIHLIHLYRENILLRTHAYTCTHEGFYKNKCIEVYVYVFANHRLAHHKP